MTEDEANRQLGRLLFDAMQRLTVQLRDRQIRTPEDWDVYEWDLIDAMTPEERKRFDDLQTALGR